MIKVKFTDFYEGTDEFKRITLDILTAQFGEVQETEEPDFLFYSVAGYDHLKYNCVRIFWTGENLQPDFNICDYAVGFSYMEYGDRYLRAPLYLFYRTDYELALEKHLITDAQMQEKTKFCNFVYSNNKADRERREIFERLSQYKRVDSGGRYLNNIGQPVEDKLAFQKEYRFSIAFENASAEGYTTEKIVQAFAAATIPIYWGDPTVADQFNPKAFINCHDYGSMDEVVETVKRIDKDEALFADYIRQPIWNTAAPSLDAYRSFLIHIFSQEPQQAYRRSNILAGKKYQARMAKMAELYTNWKEKDDRQKKNPVRRIARKLKQGQGKA
jgi:hypothetical protein